MIVRNNNTKAIMIVKDEGKYNSGFDSKKRKEFTTAKMRVKKINTIAVMTVNEEGK